MQKLQEQTLDTALRPYYCRFPRLAEGRVSKAFFPVNSELSHSSKKSFEAFQPNISLQRDMLSWGRVLPLSLRARKLFHEKYFAISSMWLKLFPEKKNAICLWRTVILPYEKFYNRLWCLETLPQQLLLKKLFPNEIQVKWKNIYPCLQCFICEGDFNVFLKTMLTNRNLFGIVKGQKNKQK